MTSIKLFRGRFGHVSLIRAANDLVTHAHPESHIVVWLHGAPGRMEVCGEAVEPGPEMAVGVNPFEPHSHSFAADAPPGQFLVFHLDPAWAAERLGLRAGAPRFLGRRVHLPASLRSLCAGLVERLAEGAEDWGAYEFERLVETLVDTAGEAGARLAPSRTDHRVRKAVALMRADIAERVSLDQVARRVGLSRPHFFALFKEQMRLTPNVFRNTLRMEEALRRLEAEEEPLTAVACELGFSTQGNFSRFFRDHAGVPPTLYREAVRAG